MATPPARASVAADARAPEVAARDGASAGQERPKSPRRGCRTGCRWPAATRRSGGQAVLEGVMMRGVSTWAVAVRKPDGEIEVTSEPLVSWAKRHRLLRSR